MDVSVIIVNYYTKELTRNCIDSIYKNTKDIEYEIILVDNNSIDGTCEYINSLFPQVIILRQNENLGFGTANNRGIKISKGKYIF